MAKQKEDGFAFSLTGQYIENKKYINYLTKTYDDIVGKVDYYSGKASEIVKYEVPAAVATVAGLFTGTGVLEASDVGTFTEIANLYTQTPVGKVALGLTSLGLVGLGISSLVKKHYETKITEGMDDAMDIQDEISIQMQNQRMLYDSILENASDPNLMAKTLGMKTKEELRFDVEQNLDKLMKVSNNMSQTDDQENDFTTDFSSQDLTE